MEVGYRKSIAAHPYDRQVRCLGAAACGVGSTARACVRVT